MATAIEYHRRLRETYGDSNLTYMQHRRARAWAAGRHGLNGYAQFLAGYGDASSDATASLAIGSVVGAETAELDSMGGDPAWRAIAIGVSTGVLTFLLNRWLGKVLG